MVWQPQSYQTPGFSTLQINHSSTELVMVQDGYWKSNYHIHIPDRKKKEGQKDSTSQLLKFTSEECVPKSLIIFLLLSNCPEFSHEATWFLRVTGFLAVYTDTSNNIGILLVRKKERTYLE